MTISCAHIETVLRIEDIESLIEFGAPDNEYDSEAKEMFELLERLDRGQFTEDGLVSVVSRVWGEMFDLDEEGVNKRMPAFRNVAKNILLAEGR